MTFQFKTEAEARAQYSDLVVLHYGTDWEVTITAPLFDGDVWTVSVG